MFGSMEDSIQARWRGFRGTEGSTSSPVRQVPRKSSPSIRGRGTSRKSLAAPTKVYAFHVLAGERGCVVCCPPIRPSPGICGTIADEGDEPPSDSGESMARGGRARSSRTSNDSCRGWKRSGRVGHEADRARERKQVSGGRSGSPADVREHVFLRVPTHGGHGIRGVLHESTWVVRVWTGFCVRRVQRSGSG